jgi:hypothetical protein
MLVLEDWGYWGFGVLSFFYKFKLDYIDLVESSMKAGMWTPQCC